ncbi:uncharacterized protein LODBEIA_P34730 [Lodderomyces beijingensis]|uniref:Glycogenin glucosyltransferase n=1 Tax=Lodderomyces beijingensis TaxID=1775926 RepID=A0ABP0ZM84_9ASCO
MTSAYATLLVGESYVPGVLTLGSKLKQLKTKHKLVVLLDTESISSELRDLIATVYDEVIPVDTIESPLAKLQESLKGRDELSITYTKLLLWGLTQYDSVVYLDADVLPLQNFDEIFDKFTVAEDEIAASPDSGWPDIFNSGVFKLKPSTTTQDKLIEFASKGGAESTFDGADQGLLNEFFPTWTRLPYLYNVTPNYRQDYQYLPAFNRFFNDIKILHYIGAKKPWHYESILASDLANFHQYWWDDFNKFYSDGHLKYKLLNLPRGEGSNLKFAKLTNKWDEEEAPHLSGGPSLTAGATAATSDVNVEHAPIFPWEEREKREATRVFHDQKELPSYEQSENESFDKQLQENLERLKSTKVGPTTGTTSSSTTTTSEPTTKNASLSKEYGFDQQDKSFNPDKSLDEVAKLPLKFLSKEKAKRESEEK